MPSLFNRGLVSLLVMQMNVMQWIHKENAKAIKAAKGHDSWSGAGENDVNLGSIAYQLLLF